MPALRPLAYVPPGALLVGGIARIVLTSDWRSTLDLRVLDGHGYILYAFTMVIFGGAGLLWVRRWGYRGLFVLLACGVTCDMAQTFLSVYPGSPVWQIFTTNYALEPIFWMAALTVCSYFLKGFEVNAVNPWVVGMLLSWLVLVQIVPLFGIFFGRFLEPATESGWVVAAWKSVSRP
jgi:hypothetical protein